MALQAEGRVSAQGGGDSGAAPRDPLASLAPGQVGFLAVLTHFQAWFVSGKKPQLGVGCSPGTWHPGPAGVPGAPCLGRDRQRSFPLLPALDRPCQALSQGPSPEPGARGSLEGVRRWAFPRSPHSVTNQAAGTEGKGAAAPCRASLTFPTRVPK